MIEVAGSLWSVAPAEQEETALRLQDAGLRRLHWDATDVRFAAAGGFDAERARMLAAATGLAAEAHLMTERSAAEVDAWTDFCDLVVVHAESADWGTAIDRIVQRGGTPGLAISPQTPASAVPADIDVLCMSIVPGRAGSAFDPAVLEKVSALRSGSATRRIGIDGGVQRKHAESAAAAGADWIVVGTDLVFDGAARWAALLTPAGR